MTRNDIFGIVYVSIWVLIWGTVGSIIDLPFLNSNIYQPGSIGQLTTFLIIGILSTIVGILLFERTKSSSLVVKIFGLSSQ